MHESIDRWFNSDCWAEVLDDADRGCPDSIELMEGSLRLTGSALNLTDERAPLAPHEQGYDAYTHNPLGRVFQVGLRYTLGNG